MMRTIEFIRRIGFIHREMIFSRAMKGQLHLVAESRKRKMKTSHELLRMVGREGERELLEKRRKEWKEFLNGIPQIREEEVEGLIGK